MLRTTILAILAASAATATGAIADPPNPVDCATHGIDLSLVPGTWGYVASLRDRAVDVAIFMLDPAGPTPPIAVGPMNPIPTVEAIGNGTTYTQDHLAATVACLSQSLAGDAPDRAVHALANDTRPILQHLAPLEPLLDHLHDAECQVLGMVGAPCGGDA